jgi:hypothetical protein
VPNWVLDPARAVDQWFAAVPKSSARTPSAKVRERFARAVSTSPMSRWDKRDLSGRRTQRRATARPVQEPSTACRPVACKLSSSSSAVPR